MINHNIGRRATHIEVECANPKCHNKYSIAPSTHKNHRYCCKDCRIATYEIDLICQCCQEIFTVKRVHRKQKYCSYKCCGIAKRGTPKTTVPVETKLPSPSYMLVPGLTAVGYTLPAVTAICNKYNLEITDLRSKIKEHRIAVPRRELSYLLKETTKLSTTAIGRLIRKDHSTVVAGIKKVKNEMQVYPDYRRKIDELLKLVS